MASVESTTESDEEEAIEKIWRTLHGRVKNRSAAIHSQEDMESVIQEEWDRLALDRSQYDEDGFIGIKIFGKKQQDACDAVGISRSMFSTGGWLQRFNRCCRRVLMRTDGTLATCGNHCDTIPTIIKQSKVLQ